MYKWLDNALDIGISEQEFWNMTVGEVSRAFQSHHRIEKNKAREQATHYYILADLVARSIGRLFSSTATMPEISEVYPTLFDSKEILERKQEKQAELSAIRFKQFAQSFNSKFQPKEEAKDK